VYDGGMGCAVVVGEIRGFVCFCVLRLVLLMMILAVSSHCGVAMRLHG
jgi:hypothetical protein